MELICSFIHSRRSWFYGLSLCLTGATLVLGVLWFLDTGNERYEPATYVLGVLTLLLGGPSLLDWLAPPKDPPRPLLSLFVKPEPVSYQWAGAAPIEFQDVVLKFRNVGEELAVDVVPTLIISDRHDQVLFDSSGGDDSKAWEVAPSMELSIRVLDTLARRSVEIMQGIEIYDIQSVLERRFKLSCSYRYKAPDRIRTFEIAPIQYEWEWSQPDTLQNKIQLRTSDIAFPMQPSCVAVLVHAAV
jgi:hypothetical protein